MGVGTDRGMEMDQSLVNLESHGQSHKFQMDWRISYNLERKFVRVEITGRLISGLLKKIAIDSVKFAREQQSHKFLVDIGQSVLLCSTNDIYQFMTKTHMGDLGLTVNDHIAFTSQKDEVSYRFAETVGRNRGWVGLTYFLQLEDAEKWLASFPD